MNKMGAAKYSLSALGGSSPGSQNRGDSLDASGGKTAGTIVPPHHRSLPVQNPHPASQLPALTTPQIIRETQDIVLRFPIKEMAEMQGATTRAVEAQRNGDSTMSLRAAVNACRANPRARAMFARLIGIPGQCSDPDFMEGLEKVVDYFLRQPGASATAQEDEPIADLFGTIQ